MTISDDLLKQIQAIDTPTLSNAIEKLEVRNRVSGFCDRSMRCLFPDLGVMCGYAVTAEVETMLPDHLGGLDGKFVELCKALEETPGPTVVVLREAGPHTEFSTHCGEVMATTFQKLGSVGLVSDAAVRDVCEVKGLGYHYFAPGMVASHATFRIVRVQIPVTVCGLPLEPGDLLHGDANGLIKVPKEGIEQLPRLVEEICQVEKTLLDCVKSDKFNIDGLRKCLGH